VWTGRQGDDAIDTALSPVARPDPCDDGGLVRRNLALGAAVRASAEMPAEPAEAAVDGQLETIWSAGSHPPQWLEIDLGEPFDIGSVEIVVSQDPAGHTRHRLLVGSRRDDLAAAGVVDQATSDGDILEVMIPSESGRGVRFVRIETVSGPSWVAWREVRVLSR
jgi:hypothetical protein